MAVGVLTAAVGFRFLYQIVDFDQAALPESQTGWFIFADVLLTGAILAGGSKAIHSIFLVVVQLQTVPLPIFSVYETFMNSTQANASAIII